MKYEYITDRIQLSRALSRIEKDPILYLDTETTADRIRLVQIGNEEEVFVIDVFELPQSLSLVGEVIREKGIVGHNLKFDLKLLLPHGIKPLAVFDTMIGSYLLGFERHSLSHVTESMLGYTVDKSLQLSDWSRRDLTTSQIEYAAKDVVAVRELFPKIRDKINSIGRAGDRGEELLRTRTAKVFGLTNPAAVVEMAFVQEVAKLELSGFPVDEEEIDRSLTDMERKLQKLIMDFYIKYRTDPLSPKQVGALLREKLGLSLPETQKGNVSTDDKVLSEFSHVKE
ncbi:MAG TPA: bifunctional 3'-5' exonuclease/DNA polymerase, partial [Aquifex aeolicus]|nr:bifunctional 3'-5' exonuclease/DNA polymerase [Aquifex aeolicus]